VGFLDELPRNATGKVVFTSGSTGTPKATAVRHSGVVQPP
jgi:acyl-coenzyme A synthetase/AMP-(fatty) acid ligase